MPRQYYAHSLEGKPPSEWQPLEVQPKRGKNVPILQGHCELVRQEKGRAEWKRPSGFRFKEDL